MKRLYLLILISFYSLFAFSQKDSIVNTNSVNFFPTERIFSLINLDPLTCKIYGGIHILFEDGNKEKGVFIPVNLGFSKPFFGYKTKQIQLEIGLEAASYTQFEIVQVDNNTYLGGLYNNDYKASVYISALYHNFSYRIRLFHISSHLGDDYMIRNNDYTRNDKSVNYEQIDLTVLRKIRSVEYYIGSGYIITPNAFRERLSFQGGLQFNIESEKTFQWVGGIDIKSFDQNNFYPNIRAAIGTEYKMNKVPDFRIQLEFYHGHLPYSTLEYRKITWLGISSNIDI